MSAEEYYGNLAHLLYPCPVCEDIFTTEEGCAFHVRNAHPDWRDGQYENADPASGSPERPNEAALHANIAPANPVQQAGPLQIPVSPFAGEYAHDLMQHQGRMTSADEQTTSKSSKGHPRVKCECCTRTFSNNQNMMMHMHILQHHPKRDDGSSSFLLKM